MDASDAGLADAEEAGVAVGEGAGAGVAAWQATSIVKTPRQPTIETDLLICPPITPVSDRKPTRPSCETGPKNAWRRGCCDCRRWKRICEAARRRGTRRRIGRDCPARAQPARRADPCNSTLP